MASIARTTNEMEEINHEFGPSNSVYSMQFKTCMAVTDEKELKLNPLLAKWPMEPALIYGFCSVKRMRVLTPTGINTKTL